MRDYEFLPYEKAIEAMAREYAKVRPQLPLNDITPKKESKQPPFNSFIQLENVYCNNLELLILLRQLQQRVIRKELYAHIEHLISFKMEISKKLEKVYFEASGKYPISPVVPKLIIPAILRRLIGLQSNIVQSVNKLITDYPEISELEQEEIKASVMLDNIIIVITSL